MPHDSRRPPLLARHQQRYLKLSFLFRNQRRSFCGPTITVEGVPRVILYTRAVQAVCRQDFPHFMHVEAEVSVTAQKLRRVETDFPMLSFSLQPRVFDQHSRSNVLLSPRLNPKPFATSQECGASLTGLPSLCRLRLHCGSQFSPP